MFHKVFCTQNTCLFLNMPDVYIHIIKLTSVCQSNLPTNTSSFDGSKVGHSKMNSVEGKYVLNL